MRGNSAPVEALLGETTTAPCMTWVFVGVVLVVLGAVWRRIAFARRLPPTTLDRFRKLPKG